VTDEIQRPDAAPEPGLARLDPVEHDAGSRSSLLETATIEAYLDGFTARAATYLGADIECGITVRQLGRDRRAASSDARVARCDDVELAIGAGPCLTAMDERRTLTTREIWRDDRWVAWRDAAELEGFRSAAAVPASAGAGTEIALNLYSEQADPWGPEQLVRAELFAEQIAQVTALCIGIAEQTVINADLTAAMASRSTIDQAIGIIMAQNRCSTDDAFAILRRASSHRNVKLRVVAAAVVQGITGVAPAAGQFRPRQES